MRNSILFLCLLCSTLISVAQSNLTIDKLWSLGRVAPQGMSEDGKLLYYSVSIPDMNENKSKTKYYSIPFNGGKAREIASVPEKYKITLDGESENIKFSSDGKKVLFSKEVKINNHAGSDFYPALSKSNVLVYDELNQRHWDTWEDGKYAHVFLINNLETNGKNAIDIMANEAYDCPQKPFGGAEDFVFSPDNKKVLYVTKKLSGQEYAISTNTDIYAYDIENQSTTNLTKGMQGYDTNPVFSSDGNSLAWLSMKTANCESDKNEIWIMNWKTQQKTNLTKTWDETVNSIKWSNDNQIIYFTSPYHGTEQLFEANIKSGTIRQITSGQFNVTDMIEQQGNSMLVSRTDMNHASEIFKTDLINGKMSQITHVNDQAYKSINMCEVKERYTSIDANTKVFSWVIYPPNFDENKKYPTLLYCQGGPQSALSQFYSFRWNFQLMASQGYIVIAPNRTGMPGWGVQWNADISKDWGGNPMRDYLAVIDDISNEKYVDKGRRGAVGASYGGYSVFMLAGIHQNRFKTFIAHDGLFDLKSWYGTTEELWFANWDIGGAYWDKNNKAAQKSYEKFSPSNYIDKWNTPILIYQGGKDFRVGIEQGLQAFQAAKLKGLKSRLVYLPDENHWVLKAQNAIVWQNEFYKWLKETL